jgi:hypothetical protein
MPANLSGSTRSEVLGGFGRAPEGEARMLDEEAYVSETSKFSRVIGSLLHVLQVSSPPLHGAVFLSGPRRCQASTRAMAGIVEVLLLLLMLSAGGARPPPPAPPFWPPGSRFLLPGFRGFFGIDGRTLD